MSSIVILPDTPSGCSEMGTKVQIQNSLLHKNQPHTGYTQSTPDKHRTQGVLFV